MAALFEFAARQPGEKVTAEIYRALRLLRLVTFHPRGHVEIEDGIIKFSGAVNKVALTLDITLAGIVLLNRPPPIISIRSASPIRKLISRRCSSGISRTSSPR